MTISNPPPAALTALPEALGAQPWLQHIGRHCTCDFLVEVGEDSYLLAVRDGCLQTVRRGPFRMRAWTFALRAPAACWQQFWSACPPRGFQDIFAMSRYGHMRIEGDIGPLLTHLRFFKELLALPRETGGAV